MKTLLLISIVFISLIIAAPFTQLEEPIVISLTDRSLQDGETHQSVNSFNNLDNTVKRTQAKFKRNQDILEGRRSNDLHRRDILIGQPEMRYSGTIMVGTPPKPFMVTFDTTNFDILLPSITCKDCSYTYNPKESSTSKDLKKSFKSIHQFGSTTLPGSVYSDFVSLNGFNVSNQVIGAFDTISTYELKTPIISGIFGLAPTTFTNLNIGTHFFQNLIINGVLKSPTFGIYFDRNSMIATSNLILGGFNKTMAGNPNYNKVIKGDYWSIHFDSILLNQNEIIRPTQNAIIDTGSSYIFAPPKDVSTFYRPFPNSKQYQPSAAKNLIAPLYYSFGCGADDFFPKITFVFNSVRYPILQTDFIAQPITTDPNNCIGSVIGSGLTRDKSWVLGTAFLKNVYTVFDLGFNQVGFTSISTFNPDI